MFNILRAEDQQRAANRTLRFEGEQLGGPVSFFLVDAEPGQGSMLHVHPYAETWVVRSGKAEFTVGGKITRGYPGDIVVAAPDVPHRFENVGEGRLELICIHPNGRILQQNL